MAPLKYGLKDQERKLLAIRFDKYIDKAFKTGIKQLIFVTHPHKNHLTKKKIFTPTYWPINDEFEKSTCVGFNFQKKLVHLPLDQNLTRENLNFIINELQKVY